jgi:hypothetical protein
VTTEPAFATGATHETAADESPGTATTFVGASGTTSGVTDVAGPTTVIVVEKEPELSP